jgi:acetyl-CoA acetyltransferase
VVVTTYERARDAANGGSLVVAGATGSDAGHLMDSPAANAAAWADRATTGGMVDLASELWARAGVAPGDIDVAQLYDNFSGNVLLALEDFGFCEPGESGPFAASGALRWPDGALPTNTAGGNLSEGYLQGLNHVVEGVRQIRGESACQVAGAELCLVTSSPGIPTSALILGAM